MADLETIRNALRAAESRKKARQDSGRLGEIVVERWLREACRMEVEPIPQTYGTRSRYVSPGGKRPDFAIEVEGEAILVDAKLHSIGPDGVFSLSEEEASAFRIFMDDYEVDTLLLALLPRESVDCLFLLKLSEVAEDNEFGPVGTFKLDFADPQHCVGSISREAWEAAVTSFRAEGYALEVPSFPAPATPSAATIALR